MRVVPGIALTLWASTACLFDAELPAGAALACADGGDCPPNWRCDNSLCLAPGSSLPMLDSVQFSTEEDVATTLTFASANTDQPRFVVVDPPAHGRLTCDDGSEVCRGCEASARCQVAAAGARYLPDQDWAGTDLLGVVVEDAASGGALRGAPISVAIDVLPINDAPVQVDAPAMQLDEDGADAVSLSSAVVDVDGDPLTFTILGTPALGLATEDDRLLVYTGLPNRSGSDVVDLSVSDGVERIDIAIPVEITSVNDPPSGANIDIVVLEDSGDTDVTDLILADAVDIDGDALTLSADPDRPANHGVVSDDDGVVGYRPNADYFGPDAFGALIRDANGGATPVVVRVLVEPVEDPPVALPVEVALAEDQPAIVVLEGANPDGTQSAFQLTSAPFAGALSGFDASRGVALYTPAADSFGEDMFTFRLVDLDTGEQSGDAEVRLHVAGVPDPPRVVTTTVEVPAAETTVLLDLIIMDPDGDAPLGVTVVRDPAHGVVFSADGSGAPLVFERFDLTAFLADSFVVEVKDAVLTGAKTTVGIVLTSRESCAHILNAGESVGDGVHVIDPGVPGGGDAYLAHCDMTTAGGGWTLALRADGRSNTFSYDQDAWTNGDTINPESPRLLELAEAKLASYLQAPVTEVLLGFSPFTVVNGQETFTGVFRYVRGRLRPDDASPFSSLREAVNGTPQDLVTVPAGALAGAQGRERWLSAVRGMSLQDKCNRERVDNLITPAHHAVRIGILGNDQDNCASSESFIGVGSNKSPTSGQRRAYGPCVSSADCDTAFGEQCIESVCVEAMPAFGVVLVRGRDFTSLGSRASCDEHAAAGAVVGGRFLVGGAVVDCAFAVGEAICGDGFIDLGEECDDDNATSGDRCDRHCLLEECGNGRVEDNEECDDGNLASGDGCDANCTRTRCGNGVVTDGEECDDNALSGDGCDALCQIELCGNRRVELNEQCDDGNTTSGDGCESDCRRPIGGTCFVAGTEIATPAGDRAVEALAVGDEVLASGADGAARAVVSHTWRRASDHLRLLQVDDVVIRTTDEHPFFVVGRGLARAGDLMVGDPLVTLDGRTAHVRSSERLEGSFEVFNVEVAGSHTYFVSPMAVLVHNKDPGPQPGTGTN